MNLTPQQAMRAVSPSPCRATKTAGYFASLEPAPSRWCWRCTKPAYSAGHGGDTGHADQASPPPATLIRARPAGRLWPATLETLVATKGVTTSDVLLRYRDAWDHAADRTPHGAPIELTPGDFRS